MARTRQTFRAPDPLPGRTAPDGIVSALRADILSGAIAPGTMLRQVALAERFGVSRIPVRDALRSLEVEGLVTVEPNRGASVIRFTVPDLREIYDLRRLLEGDLMLRATRRMGPGHVSAIEAALAQAEAGAGGENSGARDDALHAALYAPAERPRQVDMVMNLRRIVRRYENASPDPRESDDHRALLAACEAGDGMKACRLLDDHLKRAGEVAIAATA
jgi:DNA-binding GntR family transcriptional regulator